MTEWFDVLVVTDEFITENHVFKLYQGVKLIAYYGYIMKPLNSVHLESLFVLPDHIGQGYGGMLMQDFLQRAKESGITCVTLESDPNATAFYERLGFVVVESKSSTINGRILPVMKLEI